MSLSTSTPSFGSSLNRRARRFFSELSHPILAVSTKRYQVHALAPSWSNLCPCSCPPSLPKRAATSKPCHGECSWPRLNPKLCPGIVWDNATWLRSKRDHSKVDDRIPVGGNLLGHGLIYYDMPSLSYCYDWNSELAEHDSLYPEVHLGVFRCVSRTQIHCISTQTKLNVNKGYIPNTPTLYCTLLYFAQGPLRFCDLGTEAY